MYQMYSVPVFSFILCCLFTLFIVSFAVQTLFSQMQLPVSIFTFVACAFGVLSKNSLPRPMSIEAFPLYSLLTVLQFPVFC